MRKRIFLFWMILLTSSASAQLTYNALEKMQQPFSFKQQSIIARIMATQATQIEEGQITEFESRCIASNMVHMFGDANAERFIEIAEKAYTYEMDALAVADINFMKTINDKYLPVLSIVAEECSQNELTEDHE